uniref:Secreted protein n=2 Tax=Steinernema glaseri TaxID=37863 RepID=A0A1I7ZV18_9BILA
MLILSFRYERLHPLIFWLFLPPVQKTQTKEKRRTGPHNQIQMSSSSWKRARKAIRNRSTPLEGRRRGIETTRLAATSPPTVASVVMVGQSTDGGGRLRDVGNPLTLEGRVSVSALGRV